MISSGKPLVFYLLFCSVFLLLLSCEREVEHRQGYFPYYFGSFDPPPVNSKNWSVFDPLFEEPKNQLNEFGLTKVPQYVYKLDVPKGSFGEELKQIETDQWSVKFYPLDQELNQRYQYTHRYLCKYQPEYYYYANIAYPDPCERKQYARARVELLNKTDSALDINLRMFYQNTSYWFPTDSSIELEGEENYRTNYFGSSKGRNVTLEAGANDTFYLPYIIGKDPKDDSYDRTGLYGPARTGDYEFMLWVKEEDQTPPVWRDSIVLWQKNPFAEIQKELLKNDRSFWDSNLAYIPSGHFRFKLLNEKFDGANILEPGWVYFLAERDHKPLCDGCAPGDSIMSKDIIWDDWSADSFFHGALKDIPRVKVEYGNRDDNVTLTKDGIFLRIPGSNEEKRQKTWGEFKFMPEFQYGKVKIVAKLAQIRNKASTPTGIIHNIWLYQKRHRRADSIPGNPYNHLLNDKKKQPYEIDIEIWTKIYEEKWKDIGFANYSIVDYMRDENVLVKPGKDLKLEGDDLIDRYNEFQLNYPKYEALYPDFFDDYHLFEILWDPKYVEFFIDGISKAKITSDWAKIPDQPCNVWINSPIYQDGTYYDQRDIPFFSKDYFTHIRYISIE